MSEDPSLEGVLEFVKRLAAEASELARARSSGLRPVEKTNRSYVTELDQELERFIRTRLAAAFPQDRLTGEEFAEEGGGGPRRWSIDPIDGTGNLVHSLPLWAISIGLIEDGEPLLGVIAIPPLNELYWGLKGEGAWLNGVRLRVVDADSFHPQDNVCVGTNALRAIDPRSLPGRLRDLGSSCCEQAFVAANRLQACTFLGEAAHDLAAGVVISSEAGCGFGTVDGRLLDTRQMILETPIRQPTFVAPPRRLQFLLNSARPLPPVSSSP